jgi:hypothetical protein
MLLICLLALCVCTRHNTSLVGGTSETTNGFTATIHTADGKAVACAQVRLRPANYVSDTSASATVHYMRSSVVDTVTDSAGKFTIDSLDSGDYVIEINNGNGLGVLVCQQTGKDSVVNCGIKVMQPEGIISGVINQALVPAGTTVYVQILGVERLTRFVVPIDSFVMRQLPAGAYNLRFCTSLPTCQPQIEIVPFLQSGTVVSIGQVTLRPYIAWSFSKIVTMNTTSSGANVAGTVVNFPVLIRLTSANFTFANAQAHGSDIRFAKADGTPLPYEIEQWNATTGEAEIWVKVDTVYGNDSTHSFMMYWGASTGSATTSLSNSAAVFDTANGFQGVWHLDEAENAVANDATVNGYNGAPVNMTSATQSPGAIGAARSFDGSSGCIEMIGTANSKLDFPINGTYTVSAWVNIDTIDSHAHAIADKGYFQFGLEIFGDNKYDFYQFNNNNAWEGSRSPAIEKTWVYLTGVRSGNTQSLYVNGTYMVGILDTTRDTTKVRNENNNVMIGKMINNPSTDVRYFKGKIDEVRMSNIACTPDWIKLCYMNQQANDKLVNFK